MDSKLVNDMLAYHKTNAEQKEMIKHFRDVMWELAHDLNDNLPDSREKSLAFTKLEECLMWTNKAISKEGEIDG